MNDRDAYAFRGIPGPTIEQRERDLFKRLEQASKEAKEIREFVADDRTKGLYAKAEAKIVRATSIIEEARKRHERPLSTIGSAADL